MWLRKWSLLVMDCGIIRIFKFPPVHLSANYLFTPYQANVVHDAVK